MDWRQTLEMLGLADLASPDVGGIALALALIGAAYAIGWFVAARTGPAMVRTMQRWTGRDGDAAARILCATLRHGLTALLLLVAANSAGFAPFALMLLAAALGIAVALMVYRTVAIAGLGAAGALLLAGIALIATAAGTLGGMAPLVAGLSGVGFSVGARRFTLLAAINFVIVAAALFVVARIVNRMLMHSIGRIGGLDLSQRALIQKLAGIAVIVVAVLFGIDLLGIDLTALAVFSGALGLAVGFGLQKTLGNLIAGLILLMDRSVKPGDVIVVGDSFGTVGKIGVRAVSVITRDGKEHLIPNEQLMTEPVENWSYTSRNVRVHVPVSVAYDCDVLLAQRLMVDAARAARRVLADPRPSVWMKDFGDNGIEFDILVWVADPEAGVGNVRSDILNRLWVLFGENGIRLPYPQREIHLRSWPAAAAPPPPADGESVPG